MVRFTVKRYTLQEQVKIEAPELNRARHSW